MPLQFNTPSLLLVLAFLFGCFLGLLAIAALPGCAANPVKRACVEFKAAPCPCDAGADVVAQ